MSWVWLDPDWTYALLTLLECGRSRILLHYAVLHSRIFGESLVVGSFTSWQHLRSYQDGKRLVTVIPRDNFILPSHWEIRPPAPWPDIPLSHIILALESTSSILIMSSTWLGNNKYQFFSHWFHLTMGSNPMVYQNPRRTLNSFGHPVWSAQ